MWRGGSAGGRGWRLTLEQMREPMEASGLVTAADLSRLGGNMRKIWIALLVMAPCLFARGDEKNCKEVSEG
jgi:hypothetical protein